MEVIFLEKVENSKLFSSNLMLTEWYFENNDNTS